MKSMKAWCQQITEWREKKGFKTNWNNVPEKLLLIHSEISEAAEALRHMTIKSNKPKNDEFYKNFVEELADVFIRLGDLCGSLNIDLENEVENKMSINEKRPIKHGKKF